MAIEREVDITGLLTAWSQGDGEALERLAPLVYGELCELAAVYRRGESRGHTLLTRDLVHEAYLRLVGREPVDWQSRCHFFGVAARLMRQVLVDHARRKRAAKRGRGRDLSLDEALTLAEERQAGLVELDEALERLAELDPRQSRIVELRFFAGYSVAETAEIEKLSPATVKREWATAKAWLSREMSRRAEP